LQVCHSGIRLRWELLLVPPLQQEPQRSFLTQGRKSE